MQPSRSMRSDRIFHFTFLPILALALAAVPLPAHADSPAETGAAVDPVKLLHDHVRAKDADAIRRDLAAVAAAYPEAKGESDRRRMLAAVAKVLRLRNEDLRSDALDAYEEMGDPNAWRHYGSLLSNPFKKEFPRLASQAMDVTRALKPESAVSRLLVIARKSRNLAAAAKAVETLGAYGESRQRGKILGEIIAVTQKEKPGIRGRDNTVVYGPRYSGDRARNRWQALAGPMVEAANELTGLELSSAEEWFELWRANKSKPAELFERQW